jgi:hypothetical protein
MSAYLRLRPDLLRRRERRFVPKPDYRSAAITSSAKHLFGLSKHVPTVATKFNRFGIKLIAPRGHGLLTLAGFCIALGAVARCPQVEGSSHHSRRQCETSWTSTVVADVAGPAICVEPVDKFMFSSSLPMMIWRTA